MRHRFWPMRLIPLPRRSARDAAPLEVEVAVLDAAPARVTEAEPLDVEAADALMG